MITAGIKRGGAVGSQRQMKVDQGLKSISIFRTRRRCATQHRRATLKPKIECGLEVKKLALVFALDFGYHFNVPPGSGLIAGLFWNVVVVLLAEVSSIVAFESSKSSTIQVGVSAVRAGAVAVLTSGRPFGFPCPCSYANPAINASLGFGAGS